MNVVLALKGGLRGRAILPIFWCTADVQQAATFDVGLFRPGPTQGALSAAFCAYESKDKFLSQHSANGQEHNDAAYKGP